MKFLRHALLVLLASLSLPAFAAERTTYFVPDAQGSPVAAMDEQGNLLWRETYRPYGERQARHAENDARSAYTGKPEDRDTGLVYMGARWYDPATARFTGIDPVGFVEGNPQSFARYTYANNSPYRYVDPNGETPIDAIFLAYDAAAFALALQSGNPAAISAAAENLGASLVGVASPIPGTGQAIKAARAADSARTATKALSHYDPPNNGSAIAESAYTLLPGAVIDRRGFEGGRYFAPEGTPEAMRALSPGSENKPFNRYIVKKPLDTQVGITAPAYGKPGMGTQYRTEKSAVELERAGYLEKANR